MRYEMYTQEMDSDKTSLSATSEPMLIRVSRQVMTEMMDTAQTGTLPFAETCEPVSTKEHIQE